MPLLNTYLSNRRKSLHKPDPLTADEKKRLIRGIVFIVSGLALMGVSIGLYIYLS